MKVKVILVLICLLSSVTKVCSQAFPYIRFMGENLLNNSYINVAQVGNSDDYCVQCHTDLLTCCSSTEGHDRGDWYFPNGSRLPFVRFVHSQIYLIRQAQQVDLCRRGNPTIPQGIYHCDIETNATSNDNWQNLYVGLYLYTEGDVMISDNVQLSVDYNIYGENPQFTLTCISTGGPAMIVTWTRNSEKVSGGRTVLDNAETAHYTHTLTVTGRLPGQYNCTVSNNKPSVANRSFTVQAASSLTNLMAVQEGPTGIRVSWTPPTPLGDTNGYKIIVNGSSANVLGGYTNNHLLTGLHNGARYTISIVGTSPHLSSERVDFPSLVSLFPGRPNVMMISSTATTIILSWSVPSGSMVGSYVVSWKRNVSRECSNEDAGSATITDDSTSYSIERLEEGSSYTIKVTATNMAGSVVSDPVMEMTVEVVPSSPPTFVNTTHVTSTSITVQWGAVDCFHQNGEITGYSVRYGVQGSDIVQTVNVSKGATTEVVISKLTSSTRYSIEVAAVNSAGVGNYSISIVAVTKIPDGGDSSSRTKYCAGASVVAGYTLGGLIGGVFITAVLGAVIFVIFVKRMRTKVEMQHSQSKVAKEQNVDVGTLNNLAYGYVKRVGNTQHETYDMATGAAMSNQEFVYDTIPN